MRTFVRTAAIVAMYAATVAGGVAVRAVYLEPDPPPVARRPAAAAAAVPVPAATPAPPASWGVGPGAATAPAPAASPVAPAPAVPAPPAAEPAPTPAAAPAVSPDAAARAVIWRALADCESGRWGVGKVPVPGSATWDVVDEVHQGGLQIRAGQWDQHRPPGFPADAHVATPEQQIAVAEIILAGQGWRAWPTCGPRVGLQRLAGEEIVEPD